MGRNLRGRIAASYASGNVTTATRLVGGLVGYNDAGAIIASYAVGDVSGGYAGGLVGENRGTIVASYAIGKVPNGSVSGGLVSYSPTGTATASYWDNRTSGQTASAGGVGKTTSDLQSPTKYTGIYETWNVDVDNADGDNDLTTGVDNPWNFGGPGQYPTLRNVGALMSYTPLVLASVPDLYWVDEEAHKIQRITTGESRSSTQLVDKEAQKIPGVTEKDDAQSIADLVTSAQGLNMPGSIALDMAAGKMYWTNDGAGRIRRANLDGSNIENVAVGLADPVGIALDLDAGYLYWADRDEGSIYRGNLRNINDFAPATLVSGLDKPYQIALDTSSKRMYWTERSGSKIRRADLAGNNVADIVFKNPLAAPENPHGLALDLAKGKMYWTERLTGLNGGDQIRRANLTGQNGEVIFNSARKSLSGIALDAAAGKIYWTDETRAQSVARI